jgi:uncharacterized protein YjlB
MPLTDQIKNYGRKFLEDRPDAKTLRGLARARTPHILPFNDDGIVPNNPRFPLLLYRGALASLPKRYDPAAVIDALFEANGWSRSWRDTIYDFVHYHSQIHEAMGVARGRAKVECGGIKGRVLTLKPGDVAIIPAGTGHRLLESSRDFLVVGAYPAEGTYDECTDTRDRLEAIRRIANVKRPSSDPVYGRNGPLTKAWRTTRRSRSR